MMMNSLLLLLVFAAALCNAAPQPSVAEESIDNSLEIHDRVRRNGAPTNYWWIPGAGSPSTPDSYINRVSCGDPGKPVSGSSLFESLQAGAIVVHSCNPGHRLEGAKLRLCQSNGQWTPQLPRCVFVDCGDPGAPANGNKWVGSTFLGSIVKYKCNTGFYLVGDSFRTCQANGRWTGRLPSCQPQPCPKLPSPLNGQVSINGQGASAVATYQCNNGFTLIGSERRVCQNGVWQGTAPGCRAVTCPNLPDISFGSVIVSSNSVGSVARYVCNSGFDLVGDVTRSCQSNGVWSNSEPECKEVGCRLLRDPDNGQVSLSSGTNVGSQASYTCDGGFNLVGTQVRVCQASGEWSGEDPFCQEIDCGSLSSPENGQVFLSTTTFNSVAQYVCNNGFDLIGSSQRTCQADGTWSDNAPVCRVSGCSDLRDIPNGQVFLTGITPGALATYICSAGFRLEGDRNRVCQVNGEWSSEEPICVRFSCGRLDDPENGRVSVTGVTPGSVATYRCNPGFELFGVAARSCLSNGQWSGDAPVCQAIQCPDLFDPRDGQVSISSQAIGGIAAYVCDVGFILVGSSTRTCQIDGEWSGDEPTCSPIGCDFLPDPDNGRVSLSGTSAGSTATYTCDVGFLLQGARTRVCLINGEWSGEQPFCIATELEFAFSQATYSVNEGDGFVTVSVDLVSGTTSEPIPITISTSDLLAIDNIDAFGCFDYTRTTSTVTFPAGASPGGPRSQRTITIPINDDNCVEKPENFTVEITSTNPDVTFPEGRTSTVSIEDNDIPLYRFTEPSYTVNEDDGPAVPAIELYSNTVLTFPATVRVVDIRGGTATDGVDYRGVSVNVVFPAGSGRGTEVSFNIPIIDDQLVEGDETILLEATTEAPGQVPPRGYQATVVIRDNDQCIVGLESQSYTVLEANILQEVCVVKRNAAQLSSNVDVRVFTRDISGGATAGSDYTSLPSGTTVTFGPGRSLRQCVRIPILEDNRDEPNEKFEVIIESEDDDVAIQPGEDTAEVTITDDDVLDFAFSQVSYNVNEGDDTAEVCVDLVAGVPQNQVHIQLSTSDGSATSGFNGIDFTSTTATVTFAAGTTPGGPESQMCIVIPINDDELVERREDFHVVATSTDDMVMFPNGRTTTVTIEDNDVITCDSLRDPANGDVILSGVSIGSAATYTCDDGFVIVGADTRICRANGLWSGVEPFCTPVGCDRLDNPRNGRVELTGTSVGSEATYVCVPGFQLNGQRTRQCLPSGVWSGQAPTCDAVTCPNLQNPSNGHVSLSGNTLGSTATYTCINGFGLVGVSPRICQPNGQWTGDEPSCQSAQCPELQQIVNGVISTNGMQFGDSATYSCLPGFQLIGNEVRTCQANGFWSGNVPFCQAIQCVYLEAPDNGQVIHRGTTFGSEANYNCFPGFTLNGLATRICQENGEWNGQAPTCTAIDCGDLQDPSNGQVTLTGTVFNSLAIYSCDQGFSLVGSPTRSCMSNGQWSGQAPTCASQRCGQLDPPQNGRVDISGFTVGFTATYSCFPGFDLVGQDTRTCQGNGVWSGNAPFCQGVSCSVLSAPQNGRVTLTGTQVRDTATYECLPGFILQGTHVRECRPNGQWSLQEPSCVAVDCGSLRPPQNGDVDLSGTTFRSTARYSCDAGFGLVGVSIRTCEANGQWSGSEPTCQISQCPNLDPPSDGNIATTGTDFWDTATYSCTTGFNLVGVATRTCQANGAWSGSPPFCSPAQCSVLEPPKDGQVQFTSTSFGAIATYQCHSGFSLEGNEERTCQANGLWSGSTPVCGRVDCGILISPKNGDISFSQGTVFGSQATYTCDSPFQLEGTATRVCLDSGEWSELAPTCESLECPDLSAPENGDLIQSGSVPGSVARYVCDSGFNLIGDEQRSCQGNGFWTGVTPLCQRSDCDQLKPPDNGNVDMSGTSIGSQATYSCEDGYNLVGEEFRLCQANGEWSGSEPNCIAIDCGLLRDPLNGVVDVTGTGAGDTATYHCNIGFVLFGKGIRECHEDGTWNGKSPECREVDCGRLNHPPNGFVSFSDTTFGFTATYSCDAGFELVGFSSRVCEITGGWSGEEPVCSADVCPTLIAPANGNVVQNDNEFGDTAVYNCEPGFSLSGARTRTCLDGGQWSGNAPTCDAVSCGNLQSPENGRVIFLDGTSFGSVARYDCNNGFQLVGIPIRSCEEDGNWSGVAPICQIVQCGLLDDPANGRVSLSGTGFGSQATYTCNSGFLLVGAEIRTCSADGSWTESAPICTPQEAFSCSRLSAPRNGNVQLTGTTPGSVATYRCNSGFNLVGGNENRRCVDRLGWDGSAPTCQPVDCGQLLNPPNGQVLVFQGSTFGSSAMYNCDQGFILLGQTIRRCEANGEWSGIEPTCSPIQCARLANPQNGQVSITGINLGSTATYSCEQGFTLSGQATRICESDGDWSGRPPICNRVGPVGCGDPGVPVSGRRIGDDFRLGATVYYECNDNFQLVGPASRVCQSSGLWNGFLPTCTPSGTGGNDCSDNGATVYDACGRKCTCVDGRFADCCRVRTDFASLSVDDKRRLISTMITVASDPQLKPRYDALISLYKSSFDSLAQSTDPSVSQFLPWNRFFMLEYENLLREVNCRITLPYWDWSALPLNPYMSPVFNPVSGFGDSSRANDSCVSNGPFNSGVFTITPSAGGGCLQRQYRMQMFPTRAIIEQDLLTLSAGDFTQFHQFLQVFIHTNVRCFVGGQMCSTDAANDPVYLLHLAQIDFLFDRWQRIDSIRLNARFTGDNTSLALTSGLTVSQFANNDNLASDVCILYDHPSFKTHVPPSMRFLADALEQMTMNHNLKMECVGDAVMEGAGMDMGSSGERFMHEMCNAETSQ